MIFYKKTNKGFTIIEIMVGIVIFSIIMTAGFNAYFNVLISRTKLIEKTSIEKDAFYLSEKIFELIKKGGTIDYEEYFNRKVVGNSIYSSGHYKKLTGFGNFGYSGNIINDSYGSGHYYCLSGNGIGNKVGTGGCYSSSLNNVFSDFTGEPQRYGQYSLQFIDYNSDYNNDGGNHDGLGDFKGDDDDEFLGEGPVVFTGGTDIKELYLISGDKKTRTFFRWNVKQDVNHPTYPLSSCDFTNPKNPTGSGCLGTIEFLKLEGKDWGLDHVNLTNGPRESDGTIDTWIISNDFSSSSNVVASGAINNWVSLFPEDVNVKDFKLYLYPNKDRINSWKNTSEDVNIYTYLKIKKLLTPGWKKRKMMKGKIPEIPLNSTIYLTDIFNNN